MFDRPSLETALTGAHTVLAMTTPWRSSTTVARRSPTSLSRKVPSTSSFAKPKAEQYIRGLDIKSAFYSPGYFVENFQFQTFLAPRPVPNGTWVMAHHTSPKTQSPFVDAVGDTGKFVGAILAELDKYESKTFLRPRSTIQLGRSNGYYIQNLPARRSSTDKSRLRSSATSAPRS